MEQQETPFTAQRRKLRELKARQDDGEEAQPADTRVHPKAQARRDAEAAVKPTKKASKKKSSTSTT